jgi:hypothetical protein
MRVLLLSFILSPQFCTKAGYPGMYGSCQPLIRSKLTAIDESVGYPVFGNATPTMQSLAVPRRM